MSFELEYSPYSILQAKAPMSFDVKTVSDNGFIGAYIQHAKAKGEYLYYPAIVAGALTMTAHLAGRNWILERKNGMQTTPNFYALVLGNSTCGKNLPIQINESISNALLDYEKQNGKGSYVDSISHDIASSQGLEDWLFETGGVGLWLLDEAAEILAAPDKNEVAKQMRHEILQLFTMDILRRRKLAKKQKEKEQLPELIRNPRLSIYANTVPDKFFSLLDSHAQTDGLLNRFVVFYDPGFTKKRNTQTCRENEPQQELIKLAEEIVNPDACFIDTSTAHVVRKINVPAEVDEALYKIQDDYDEAYNKADSGDKALLGRAGAEIIPKLALLYAISERRTELSLQDVRKVEEIVFVSVLNLTCELRESCTEEEGQYNRKLAEKTLKSKQYWKWSDYSAAIAKHMKGQRYGKTGTAILTAICEELVEQKLAGWFIEVVNGKAKPYEYTKKPDRNAHIVWTGY